MAAKNTDKPKKLDYKSKFLLALEILHKLERKDIPVSDLPNLIKKLEQS